MGIFAGVPLSGASNDSGVVDDGNFEFGDLCGYVFGNVRDKTRILHGDMLPLVCL